ncbi:MAG: hypothetical protein AABX23_04055 [Nanoarchaeota archaeon]
MEIYMSIDGNYTSGYLDTFVKDVTSQKREGLINLGLIEKLTCLAIDPPVDFENGHLDGTTSFDRCLYALRECSKSIGHRATKDVFSLVLDLKPNLEPMSDALAQFQCLNI